MAYKLSDNVLKNFKSFKSYPPHSSRINSLDFSPNGERMLSSSDDDSIDVYDCETTATYRHMNSKKYGVSAIRYTNTGDSAIHASTKENDTIRHLSLSDNKYIRYFQGHTERVAFLSMSPTSETFLSTSHDKTVRLWDIRAANCNIGAISLCSSISPNCVPVGNFDPDGVVFAVGYNNEVVKIFDVRNFGKNPVSVFKLQLASDANWSNLKFSPDGNLIMISTNGSVIHLMDAFSGKQISTLTGFNNSKKEPSEASFTADSKFILSGSDGQVAIWNLASGNEHPMCMLSGSHKFSNEDDTPVYCVKFNPKYMFMASACKLICLWVPSVID